MGIAAYNRGSRSISRGIDMERGTYRESPAPVQRNADWGGAARIRAKDRAIRLLRGLRRLGYTVDEESMAWEVKDRAKVGLDTAKQAVRDALDAERLP